MGEDEKKKIAELYFGTGEAQNGLSKIEEQLIRINKLTENYAKNAKTNYGKNFASNFKANTQTFDIEKLGKGAQKAYFEMQKEAEKTIRKNMEVQKSATSIYDKVADYAKTYLIYQGFNELRQSARELVDEMVNVEYQMVQIDRVLNDSSLNINIYRDRLIQLAYDYGNSFENVADITLRLAQAGFDAQESLALTEKTLLALNTAELNATQATDDMVAIMAQWGLMTGTATEQAESYSEIIDKINITADNFPTTSADIMEAMKKTSSAFKLAGMDIDETIAIIVSAEKASQRGGKAIGTALSNISQQLKTASRIDVAKDLGIDFFKDENKTEYKDLIDILGELSSKMEELKASGKESSIEMQNLLEVFTVFRRNIGASLLGEMAGEDSTYSQVMEILGDPETIGYSMRENAKHMNTAKAALEQFNATLLELKTSVWDAGGEDMFRSLLLFGNDIASGFKTLIDTFGTIPTAVGAVTLAFTSLNKSISVENILDLTLRIKDFNALTKDVSRDSDEYKKILSGTSESFQKYINNVDTGKASLFEYGKQIVSVNAKTLVFKGTMMLLQAAMSGLVTAGITVLLKSINDIINAEENHRKAIETSITNMQNEINELDEEKNSIDNLIKSYEELNSIEIENRTKEQQKELKQIQEEITKQLKIQGEYSEDIANNYDLQLKKLKEISSEKLKQQINDQKVLVEYQKSQLKGIDLGFWGNFGRNLGMDSSVIAGFYNAGIKEREDFEKITGKEGSNYLNELINSASFEEQILLFEKWLDDLEIAQKQGKDVAEAYNFVYNSLEDLKGQQEAVSDSQERLNELIESGELSALISVDDIKNVSDYEELLDKISKIETIPEGHNETLEQYKQNILELAAKAFPELEVQLNKIISNNDTYTSTIKNQLSYLDTLNEKYTKLSDAQKEYNTYGSLSSATLQDLISNDLLQYLDLSSGKIKINADYLLQQADATKASMIASLSDAAAKDLEAIATGELSRLSPIAKGAIEGLEGSIVDTGDSSITSAQKLEVFNQELTETVKRLKGDLSDTVDTSTVQKRLDAVSGAYKNFASNLLSDIDITSKKYSRSVGSGSERATKTFEQQSQERVKIFKEEIDELESLEKAWVNKYKKLELFGTSDLKYITHQRINRYNDYLNQIRNLTGISEEDRTDLLREYTSKRQELELEYFDLLKDQLEEQIDALEKANDEKIKLIEEEADAQIEALKKVEDENDRIRQKEEYERKRNELLYGHQGIEYWRQRSGAEAQRALLEAEQELAELDKDWEEKKEGWTLEDQIEEIENARDAQIKAIEEAQEVQIQAWKDAYQAQVNLYAETGQIIYDNSVINAGYLYNAYMDNFVSPLNTRLREIASTIDAASKAANSVANKVNNAVKTINEYEPGGSKFIGPLTVEQMGGYDVVIAQLKDRINNIGKFHGGGLVNTASEEALAIVRKNEVVLRPEWAAGLDKLVQQINNGGTLNNTSTNTNVNVYGNLANFDAIKVNERKDVANIEKMITQVLKDKFNINK